jgi:predicted nucleic acid binding AN1-type Zn finger protein
MCRFGDCRAKRVLIAGDCRYCSQTFCMAHRVPEDHVCTGLEDCKQAARQRNASKLLSERTEQLKLQKV